VLRKAGLHLLSILPKSSFGRDKFVMFVPNGGASLRFTQADIMIMSRLMTMSFRRLCCYYPCIILHSDDPPGEYFGWLDKTFPNQPSATSPLFFDNLHFERFDKSVNHKSTLKYLSKCSPQWGRLSKKRGLVADGCSECVFDALFDDS